MGDVTVILNAVSRGDRQATDELISTVYEELRRMAARQLARESGKQTLQATELVHEAYLRLVGSIPQTWENRRHFFGAAAEAMRRIIVDRARRKQSLKRGKRPKRTDIEEAEIAAPMPSEELLALEEALELLEREDPQSAELVKLRFFVGLSLKDAADILGLSRSSVDPLWAFAKTWLYHAIRPEKGPPS